MTLCFLLFTFCIYEKNFLDFNLSNIKMEPPAKIAKLDSISNW